MVSIAGRIAEKRKRLKEYYRNHQLIVLKLVFYLIFWFSIIFDIHLWFRPKILSFLDPLDKFVFIMLFNIIYVAYGVMVGVTVYVDAKKIRAGEAHKTAFVTRAETWPPYVWALLVVFFCFPFFAVYLWYRRKIFDANVNGDAEINKKDDKDKKTSSKTKKNRKGFSGTEGKKG